MFGVWHTCIQALCPKPHIQTFTYILQNNNIRQPTLLVVFYLLHNTYITFLILHATQRMKGRLHFIDYKTLSCRNYLPLYSHRSSDADTSKTLSIIRSPMINICVNSNSLYVYFDLFFKIVFVNVKIRN